MTKIKDFKEYSKEQSLNEIYQKSGMRFAFLSAPKNDNQQCCPWIKCRDYLHDAVRAYLHKDSCKIYGFSYDYKQDPPIDMRHMRMLVKHTSKGKKTFKLDVDNGVALVNHYEKIAKLKNLTKKHEVKPGIWVVRGPNFWLKSPALTSMFTFLLRLGELGIKFKDTADLEKQLKGAADEDGDNDAQYLCSTWDKMSIIVKNYKDIFLQGNKYEKCITQELSLIPIGDYHNNMGIVSLCAGSYLYKDTTKALKVFLNKKSPVVEAAEEVVEEAVPKVTKKEPVQKSKTKSLLRIETLYEKSIYANYVPASFYAATISSPKKGRKQCFELTNCKELMIASIRASLSELDNNKTIVFPYRTLGGPQIDLKATRFLVTVAGVDTGKGKIKKTWDELFFAKKVINTYEDFFGIKKTVISTIKLKHLEGLSTAWLFTSSKEWSANPVMFSIYVTLIRAAKNAASTIGTIDNFSMKTVRTYWKKFHSYVGSKNKDAFLYSNYDAILKIIKNRDKLFTKTTVEAYFADNGETDSKYYKSVGVSSLIDYTHMDGDLVKKYKQLK